MYVVKKIERVSSGLADLDQLIDGGYPAGHTMLITGTTGTCKTILGLHFITKACMGERKCYLIATEEDNKDLIAQAEALSMPLCEYFKNKAVGIDRVYYERTEYTLAMKRYDIINTMDQLQSDMIGLLDRIPKDTQCVLIDNIGTFTLNLSVNEFRAQFDTLVHGLAKRRITSVIVMDSASNDRVGGVAAYAVYGVIIVKMKDDMDDMFTKSNKVKRFMRILKIRNTNILIDNMEFDITPKGIVLLTPSILLAPEQDKEVDTTVFLKNEKA